MQGPVCPLSWRTVFVCFYTVLNLCFVQINKTVIINAIYDRHYCVVYCSSCRVFSSVTHPVDSYLKSAVCRRPALLAVCSVQSPAAASLARREPGVIPSL